MAIVRVSPCGSAGLIDLLESLFHFPGQCFLVWLESQNATISSEALRLCNSAWSNRNSQSTKRRRIMANIDWIQTKKPEALILTIQEKVDNALEISNQFSSSLLMKDLMAIQEFPKNLNSQVA